MGSDKRTLSPLVDADPDLAEKEALRNSSIVQRNELDVQARYGISVAKSNGRLNAGMSVAATPSRRYVFEALLRPDERRRYGAVSVTMCIVRRCGERYGRAGSTVPRAASL